MKSTLIVFSLILVTSCSSVTTLQKEDIINWKSDEMYVEEKSPAVAAWLNILPGVGNFYNGEIGYGVLNLLAWPASVLWAPIGAYDGALIRNWEESLIKVKRKERKEEKKRSTASLHQEAQQSGAYQKGRNTVMGGNNAITNSPNPTPSAAGNHIMHHTPPASGF